MKPMQTISSTRKDFIASNLRSQINRLSGVLSAIEEEEKVDSEYAYASLKAIEINLRSVRKLCENN